MKPTAKIAQQRQLKKEEEEITSGLIATAPLSVIRGLLRILSVVTEITARWLR